MVGRPIPFRNPAGHAGLLETIKSLIASLAQFVESRLQLAARESKVAVLHLVTLVACAAGAAVLSLFGYVFLVMFAIVGLAHLLAISWIWTALGAALLHFGGAIFCLIIARMQLKRPLFRDTASVLKEDTEWLKNLDQTKLP